MADNAGITISDVVVGPDNIVQGAAISEWVSFTPTFTNGTVGNGTATGRYRRVGNSIDVVFGWQWGSTSSASGVIKPVLPNSWTIDTTAQANNEYKSGQFWAYDQSAAKLYHGSVRVGNSYISAILNPDAAGTATSTAGEISNTLPVTWTTSDELYWTVYNLPISQWAGSGTVNLGPGAQVEYASNDGSGGTAANTQYTTGSVAGPAGSAFVAVNSTTVTGGDATDYVVNFQYPIQSDDILELQLLAPSVSQWVSATEANITKSLRNSNAIYGCEIIARDSTSVWVRFGNGGRASTSGTYGAAGAAWSTITTYKWRVRKAKASSPVGFGAASSTSSGLISAEDSGSFTGTLTGCTTSPTVTIKYARSGKIVTLLIPNITATSNSTAATITGLPSTLYPVSNNQGSIAAIQNNGSTAAGLMRVLPTGVIDLFPDAAGSNFTASGTKGLTQTAVITYLIGI
jgi:hypothetical protein